MGNRIQDEYSPGLDPARSLPDLIRRGIQIEYDLANETHYT